MSELVERLRALASDDAEITTAELIRYAQAMTEAADHISRLESDVEVLRKALADLLGAVSEDFPDDPAEYAETAVQCYGMEATPSALKFGHMRKAREALSRISSRSVADA